MLHFLPDEVYVSLGEPWASMTDLGAPSLAFTAIFMAPPHSAGGAPILFKDWIRPDWALNSLATRMLDRSAYARRFSCSFLEPRSRFLSGSKRFWAGCGGASTLTSLRWPASNNGVPKRDRFKSSPTQASARSRQYFTF